MTRSRLVVFSSIAVVALGIVAGLGALYLDPARAAVGPLPAVGLTLPASTRFVVGLDVKRLTASPFYKKYAEGKAKPETFRELEERTGLVPERDVDQLVMAGGKDQSGKQEGLVLVLGRFDRYKLSRAIETERKGVTWKSHGGTTVYLFGESEAKGPGALAFLDDHTILMGSRSAVEGTITNRAQGRTSLRSNTALMDLLGKVKPGSTFWMVGDQSLLSQMPRTVPAPGVSTAEPGATPPSIELPALKSLVVTGDIDPMIAVEAVGEASDEAAAKNLADVVRGFTALAALQARQKPELKELASAVSVTTDQNLVRVNARFPHELLEALQPQKPAAPSAASR